MPLHETEEIAEIAEKKKPFWLKVGMYFLPDHYPRPLGNEPSCAAELLYQWLQLSHWIESYVNSKKYHESFMGSIYMTITLGQLWDWIPSARLT